MKDFAWMGLQMTLAVLIERIDEFFREYPSITYRSLDRDEWRTIRDALPVWRPIETIPHDVQYALISGGTYTWDDNLGGGLPCDFVVSATFDALYKEWRDGEFTYKPTHWMPLPKPPEEP